MAKRCQQAPYCVYHSLGHNFFISAQDGGNEGRPPCKGVEEEHMKKGEEVLRISQVSSDDVELGALRVSIAGLAWEEPRECSYLEMPMGVVRDLPARVMIGGCS